METKTIKVWGDLTKQITLVNDPQAGGWRMELDKEDRRIMRGEYNNGQCSIDPDEDPEGDLGHLAGIESICQAFGCEEEVAELTVGYYGA